MSTRIDTLMPTFEVATEAAFVGQMQDLLDYRLGECPLQRATTVYINQDDAGDGSGGAGAGTEADPYLVRHLADLDDLLALLGSSGGVRFRLHEDADLRGDAGLTIPQLSCTIDSYGPDGGAAVLSLFTDDDGTGWTSTNGFHVKAYADAVSWVRLAQHPSVALDAGTETIFRKTGCNITAISVHATAPEITTGTVDGGGVLTGGSYHGLKVGDPVVLLRTDSTPSLDGVHTVASVPNSVSFTIAAKTTDVGTEGFAMQRTNNCWAYDAVDTALYVRIGANVSPGTTLVQVHQATGDIILNSYDGCRVENLYLLGCGMESVASQKYAVRCAFAGNNAFVGKNLRIYYGGHHLAGQLQSGPGVAGGMTTWVGCRLGLARSDSSGEATLLVSYNHSGGNEAIFWECEGVYGVLPDTTQGASPAGEWNPTYPRGGVLYYAHANGTEEIGLGLSWLCRSHDHAYGLYSNSSFGNTPAYTNNRGNLASYRCFIVGERFDGGNGTLVNLTYVHTVVLWPIFACVLPAGVTSIFNSGGAADQVKAAIVGPNVEVDYTNIAATGGNTPWHANTEDQYLDVVFGTFLNINCPANYISWDARNVTAPYKVAYNRWYNSIWSVSHGALRPSLHNCPNGVPTGASSAADSSLTGGGRCNAYYDTGTSGSATVYGPSNFSSDYLGHDAQTGSIDLAAEPSAATVPTGASDLFEAANTANLPYAVEWWIDSGGVVRRMPATPSIGAVQQSSPPLFIGVGGLVGAGII